MAEEFDLLQNKKTAEFQIADQIFRRLQEAMKRAMKFMDDAASECEAVLNDGALVTLDSERVTITAEKVKVALGDKAFAQTELFRKKMREVLEIFEYEKKARATRPGITVIEATQEQIKAAMAASRHTGAAALVQPTSIQLGNEAPLTGANLTKVKKSEIVKPDSKK